MTAGPWEITTEEIAALSERFSPFVTKLIEIEAKSHNMSGHLLELNYIENLADGGVDAGLNGSPGTDFIPAGDSAWQFKRGRKSRSECVSELEGATRAHEYLRNGGSYVLVLGRAISEPGIRDREEALFTKAVELELISENDRSKVRVYDANTLGRWASGYPSLRVSSLVGGLGPSAVDFDRWSASRKHLQYWTPDQERSNAIETVREMVTSASRNEARIQGESGVGKTRLVMEAIRGSGFEAMTVVVPDEREFADALATVELESRAMILVIDECPADRHIKVAERLPPDPSIKLITIGDTGVVPTRAPVVTLEPVEAGTTTEFLEANYPHLPHESRRFVAQNSFGNMRFTIYLADYVTDNPDVQAADLMRRGEVEAFITRMLPRGQGFLAATVLALLERVGWDRELRYQLEIIAEFSGLPIDEIEMVASGLESHDLVTRQGRYRSITPHPLAVFLAAEGWRHFGSRMVDEFVPALDEDMSRALFQRTADLGRFEPVQAVLPSLLNAEGPFGTLGRLEENGLGRLLTQMAIVLPHEVTSHLATAIEQATIEDLSGYRSSRRDLVWTLEKLAWHSDTFEEAADALLRLALAENETFSNNATGVWLGFFATALPATAARPRSRSAYLTARSSSEDPAVRRIAGNAAASSFSRYETVGVSGELQGGVLVEPRGTPATQNEANAYKTEMLSVLTRLSRDDDEEVATVARKKLLESIYTLIEDDDLRADYLGVLATFPNEAIPEVRATLLSLSARYARHDPESSAARAGLEEVLQNLPDQSPVARLSSLARLARWEFGDDGLQSMINEQLEEVGSPSDRADVVRSLIQEDIPAAWELGRALASIDGRTDQADEALASGYAQAPSALIGYLTGLDPDDGSWSAFDHFLESRAGGDLTTDEKVLIASAGPATDSSRERILGGIPSVPIEIGTRALFVWRTHLELTEAAQVLELWIARISSELEYSAVVDWLALFIHPRDKVPPELIDGTFRLVILRDEFPDLGQNAWDWTRLATLLIDEHAAQIGELIMELIASGAVHIFSGTEESSLMGECFGRADYELWPALMSRMDSSWNLKFSVAGWLIGHVNATTVITWVGSDLDRARQVASIASVGGDQPDDVTVYLMTEFDDDDVRHSLQNNLLSGSWMGPESERTRGLIERINGWLTSGEPSPGLTRWVRDTTQSLDEMLRPILEREAEERW